MSADKSPKPTITPAGNGPYVVKGLENLRNSRGEKLQTKEAFALCRCGASANKPYCDGAHSKIGFPMTSSKAGWGTNEKASQAPR